MEQPDTPLLMKVMGFSAYSEGWGLYSEQLADEIGAYAVSYTHLTLPTNREV